MKIAANKGVQSWSYIFDQLIPGSNPWQGGASSGLIVKVCLDNLISPSISYGRDQFCVFEDVACGYRTLPPRKAGFSLLVSHSFPYLLPGRRPDWCRLSGCRLLTTSTRTTLETRDGPDIRNTSRTSIFRLRVHRCNLITSGHQASSESYHVQPPSLA